MTAEEAQILFSDYVEGTLSPVRRDSLQAYLADNPECAAELMRFERTLTVLHRLPPREPTLDLWREFAPRMTSYQATRKQSAAQRLRAGWMNAASQVSTGVILWTHALAGRAHASLERHLLHDPFHRLPHRRG